MSTPFEDLVSRCVAVAALPDAATLIAAALRDFMRAPDPAALRQDEEEVCLHRSERLTLMSIRQTPNVLFPPHDHAMVAIIATYEGLEIAKHFSVESGRLMELGATLIQAGDVMTFLPDAVHAVANVGESYSRAVHAYLGDLVATPRSIWDPVSGERLPYSDEAYFRLARPYDPTKPFHRPLTSFAHTT